MTDLEILDLIAKELEEKTLGVTAQYLQIHQPVYQDGQLQIARIDRERGDGTTIVYLPVKDEYFFFAVYIDEAAGEIFSMDTESRNLVSLIFTSEAVVV